MPFLTTIVRHSLTSKAPSFVIFLQSSTNEMGYSKAIFYLRIEQINIINYVIMNSSSFTYILNIIYNIVHLH